MEVDFDLKDILLNEMDFRHGKFLSEGNGKEVLEELAEEFVQFIKNDTHNIEKMQSQTNCLIESLVNFSNELILEQKMEKLKEMIKKDPEKKIDVDEFPVLGPNRLASVKKFLIP